MASGNTLLALVTGAAIGAAVGLLYAPEEGTETRKKLKNKANQAGNEAREFVNSTTEQLQGRANVAKKSFSESLDSAIVSATSAADDVIGSLEAKLAQLRSKNAHTNVDARVDQVADNVQKNVAKAKNAVNGAIS